MTDHESTLPVQKNSTEMAEKASLAPSNHSLPPYQTGNGGEKGTTYVYSDVKTPLMLHQISSSGEGDKWKRFWIKGICCLCCLFCCLLALAGISYGIWYAVCESGSYVLLDEQLVDLSSPAPGRIILEGGNTDFRLEPASAEVPSAVKLSSIIWAHSESLAEKARPSVVSSSDVFVVNYPAWLCTSSETKLELSEDKIVSGEPELTVTTRSGGIELAPFQRLSFSKVTLYSSSGPVSVEQVRAGQRLEARSASGEIKALGAQAEEMQLRTSSGRVTASNLSGARLELWTASGHVELQGAQLWGNSTSCTLVAKTSSGRVTVNALELPDQGGCTLIIDSASGSIVVSVSNFSGGYSARTSSGTVKINGQECDSRSRCEVEGTPGSHSIWIKTSSGNVDFNYV